MIPQRSLKSLKIGLKRSTPQSEAVKPSESLASKAEKSESN